MRQAIENYLKAGYPFMQIVSHEEARVQGILKSVCESMKPSRPLIIWSITQGAINLSAPKQWDCSNPIKIFELARDFPDGSVIVLRDFHMFLRGQPSPNLIRTIREGTVDMKSSGKTFVIVGCEKVIPPEIEKEIVMVEFELPDRDALMDIAVEVSEFLDDPSFHLDRSHPVVAELANAATGMTHAEAENAFALSVVETGAWTPPTVYREKCQAVKRSNILEVMNAIATMDEVGGLDVAKSYINQRKNAYSPEARAFGLPMPKGLLLVGVPGGGKSLLARVVAHGLDIPLLRFDVGRVFGGIVGQSESNLRSVIKTAEAVAPCVLFIDELEKGFSGTSNSGATDGGTSSRVFGSFLTWMQDKTSPVYVVATANDVSALPPEFLRKGRFDEIFFVDLPNERERQEIFEIMATKYHLNPGLMDFNGLAFITDGFTGAEIEQVVIQGMWMALDDGAEVTHAHVTAAVNETVPLSRTMAEKIEVMRGWADGRARLATSPIAKETKVRRINA